MLEELLGGQAWLALAAALVITATLVVEQVLLARRVGAYFRAAFPLGAELVPLARAPRGSGRAHGARWQVVGDGDVVLFWADPRQRAAPRGLHGMVRMQRDRAGRVHLDVRWAPWWTPVMALAWLSVLGAARGEGAITIPLSVSLLAVLLAVQWQAAGRLATALRYALQQGGDDEPHEA